MIMKKMSETKEKLLQVGFDLIWDSSYGSVSVDDICKRAGINKGSFYHFFPSKADLVVEAYDAYWQQKRPDMDRIFSPESLAAQCALRTVFDPDRRANPGKVVPIHNCRER